MRLRADEATDDGLPLLQRHRWQRAASRTNPSFSTCCELELIFLQIGGGINHDCFRKDQRGKAVALYSLMPFLSPAVAPIMGGYLTQYISWRWVFFATSIFDLAVQIACFFLLRETHHPTILRRKAQALRKYTGDEMLYAECEGPEHSMKKLLMKSLVRPLIMLTTQPALQAMSLFRGWVSDQYLHVLDPGLTGPLGPRSFQYGIMYLVFATFGLVFEDTYNQSLGRASLNYLSLGIGFVLGLQISGTLQDRAYRWCSKHQINPRSNQSTWAAVRPVWLSRSRPRAQKAKAEVFKMDIEYVGACGTGCSNVFLVPLEPMHASPTTASDVRNPCRAPTNTSEGIPEYRLPLIMPFSLLIPLGLFLYGWSAHFALHWIVPNIAVAIMSIGLIVCFNCVQAYTVDTYGEYAASATGAAAFIRTMCGFSFPLFAPRMNRVLGIGWGNSLLGFVALTCGIAAPCLLWKYGIWLRKTSTYCTG